MGNILRSIAVFCGSSYGKNPVYEKAAVELGAFLAGAGIRLVYGGASVGLMGAVADGALRNGGEAVGILPAALRDKEIAHEKLSRLVWTETMHERKALMYESADGIISLPGGFGTLDETFEALTWGQLGIHTKPVGLLNLGGFYDPLLEMLDRMTAEGFLKQVNRDMLITGSSASGLIKAMEEYIPPSEGKWIGKHP